MAIHYYYHFKCSCNGIDISGTLHRRDYCKVLRTHFSSPTQAARK